jgi:hypothetical protein
MRRIVAGVAVLLVITSSCLAFEVVEYGFQFSLGLESLRREEGLVWWVTAAVFARLALDDEWHVRLEGGSAVTGLYPFASIEVTNIQTESFAWMGDAQLQSFPQQGMKATARLGARYATGDLPDGRLELTSYPLGWRLVSFNHELTGDFFLGLNAMADVSTGSLSTGALGGRLSVEIVPRAPTSIDPFLPIGATHVLVPDVSIRLGFAE